MAPTQGDSRQHDMSEVGIPTSASETSNANVASSSLINTVGTEDSHWKIVSRIPIPFVSMPPQPPHRINHQMEVGGQPLPRKHRCISQK